MSDQSPDLPDLLPGFAERLEARAEAVAATHDPSTRAGSPSERGTRRRWRLFGGGTLIAVVAVSGAYATGLWRPQLGSNPADAPTASARAVAPELLDRVAILRRPQTDTDRGAAATAALRFPATSRSSIQTAGVRSTALGDGSTAVLVPMIDRSTGAQELCLAVLSARGDGGRACASAAEVVEGRLVVATEASRTDGAEDDRAARRRHAAEAGGADASGGVQQDPTVAAGASRVVGVAPDGVSALWVGDAGPVRPARNVFDVTARDVPRDLRARWDN